MKKILFAVMSAIFTTSSAANVHGEHLAIAGFYLGMTNTQDAKIGLRDCKQAYSYSDITCVPALPTLPGETNATVIFNPKTRTATEIRVRVSQMVGTKNPGSERVVAPPWSASRWWQEADTLARDVQLRLGVACTSRYTDTERTSHTITDGCYKKRVSLRIRRGYNEQFEFSGRRMGNHPHFQVFLTLKEDGGEHLYRFQQKANAQKEKDKSKLVDFAAGK